MWFLAPRESVTWGPLKSDPAGSLLIKSAGIFFFNYEHQQFITIVVLSFLGKLFEAVPRLDRSIPHSRVLCSLRSFCTTQYSPRQSEDSNFSNFNFYIFLRSLKTIVVIKVFRYSFSEAIPVFFNRLKRGFFPCPIAIKFSSVIGYGLKFVKMQF